MTRASPLRLLFVGENWLGSSARGLREAFARLPNLLVDDVAPDAFRPLYRSRLLRASNRILKPFQLAELEREILKRAADADVVVFYKGTEFGPELIDALHRLGRPVVNIFPDGSPHAHGPALKKAIGVYDLVISTKLHHPAMWSSIYGFSNRCVFVPHGYDPGLHLFEAPASECSLDAVLIANGRREYYELMLGLADSPGASRLNVAIAGPNWSEIRHRIPAGWELLGPVSGRGYPHLARRAKIVIAPVQTVTESQDEPHDVDTTRTYELAAAHTFFIHRQTDYVGSLYNPVTEVPTYEDPRELAELLTHYVARPEVRSVMARAAHRRAVPHYSLDARASKMIEFLEAYA